jgi:uncharacterized membrane-anchored protein
VLHWGVGISLAFLAALFLIVTAAERLLPLRSELFYWLCILVVRAAATSIGDATVARLHLGYAPVAIAATVVLLLLVAVQDRLAQPSLANDRLPATSGLYWLTMLVAGTLGTVLGDGVGHAFGPLSIGYPASAGISTLLLMLVLGARRSTIVPIVTNYWLAIVIVRWWGTNVGDIFNFVTSIGVSISVTAATMIAVIALWRGGTSIEHKKADDERPDSPSSSTTSALRNRA